MISIRKELEAGKPQIGLCVMYPSPGVVERIGGDWDWIWVDGQHGQLGYNDVINIVRACDLVQKPAFVRVPGHEFGLIGQALDAGASGIIVPCVDTPEQAQGIVNSTKFPPLGKRSYGGRRPIDFHGRTYSDTANDDILLIAQIESPEAIDNAEAIAAIPGIDALFLGPDDIMLRRGFGMTQPRNRETLGPDMEAVMNACRKHGKIGCMPAFGPEMISLTVEYGFTLIASGGDVPFLATSSKTASEEARATLAKIAVPQSAGQVINSPY